MLVPREDLPKIWTLRDLHSSAARFPPVVSGTCVTLIGAGLIGSGIKYWGGGVFCAENDAWIEG